MTARRFVTINKYIIPFLVIFITTYCIEYSRRRTTPILNARFVTYK